MTRDWNFTGIKIRPSENPLEYWKEYYRKIGKQRRQERTEQAKKQK